MPTTIYYTVYQITNIINNKIYVGVHKENGKEYLGSGYKIKYAIKKYGKENFTKEILFTYETPEEAYQKEAEIVTEEFVHNRNTYNITVGGKIPPSWNGKKLSNNHKNNISKGHIGKKYINNGKITKIVHKDVLENFLNSGWTLGNLQQTKRKLSKETRMKISNSLKIFNSESI